jgi:TPR repeat protein
MFKAMMTLSFLIAFLKLFPYGVSLNPQETTQVVRVAREDRDPSNALKYYQHAILEGEGPARLEAMYDLAHLHSQSPEADFLLLTRYAATITRPPPHEFP